LGGSSKKEAVIEPSQAQTDAPERTITHQDNIEPEAQPPEGDSGKGHTEEEAEREDTRTGLDRG
jgi:hypothetical protein